MIEPAIRKILVVALDNLGDAIMGTAVLNPLKELHPSCEIGYWTKSYAAEVFVGHPLLNHLHACDPFWDDTPGRGKGSVGAFLQAMREIRSVRYDAAILLNTEWRRCMAAAFSGIPRRIGYMRRWSNMFVTSGLECIDEPRHVVARHLRLIEFWTGKEVNPNTAHPIVSSTDADSQLWANLSHAMGLRNRAFVSIHPFSADPAKDWPPLCWSELLTRMHQRHPDMIFVIDCWKLREELFKELSARVPQTRLRFLVNTPLRQVKCLLGHALFCIGEDSGPGHLAAALQVPLISLFGKTDPGICRPIGISSTIVVQHDPIHLLPVAEVEHAVDQLLASKAIS